MVNKRKRRIFTQKRSYSRRRHTRSNYSIFKLQLIKKIKFLFNKLFFIAIVLGLLFFIFTSIFNEKFFGAVKGRVATIYYKNSYSRFCYNINIDGVVNSNAQYILTLVNKHCSEATKSDISYNNYQNYVFPLIQIKKEVSQIPWVKDVSVERRLPYTLNVVITEYTPFALWRNNSNDTLKLVDENGSIINVDNERIDDFYYLIIVSGDGSKENIPSLFNLLSINSELSYKVDYANFIGHRRWDIILENGTVVKLPENGVVQAWSKLIELQRIEGLFIDLKTLDLRIKDKVFLEYKDKVVKEIKKL